MFNQLHMHSLQTRVQESHILLDTWMLFVLNCSYVVVGIKQLHLCSFINETHLQCRSVSRVQLVLAQVLTCRCCHSVQDPFSSTSTRCHWGHTTITVIFNVDSMFYTGDGQSLHSLHNMDTSTSLLGHSVFSHIYFCTFLLYYICIILYLHILYCIMKHGHGNVNLAAELFSLEKGAIFTAVYMLMRVYCYQQVYGSRDACALLRETIRAYRGKLMEQSQL